jgi:indolepyruvate decarboxylase
MTSPSVAEYTLARLSQLGIDKVFGVPGDYAFSIDDAVEKVEGLDWVSCANELNASYAADGYARIRGAAIMSTTYGVGELSALNGVMGSRAHRLPVFHLVGMPSERIQKLGLVTHHNLGDTVYDRFQAISASACCVSTVLTPDNCVDELERVIREALRQSMPAYIVISEATGLRPILGTPARGVPLDQVIRQRSDQKELEAAVAAVVGRLAVAKKPVALVTSLVNRYGVGPVAAQLIRLTNLPFAVTPNDKGALDESMPQYLGLYAGDMSSPKGVRDLIEDADLVLDIGGVVLTELNTGLWSGRLDPAKVVSINDNWTRVGDKVFIHVAIGDLLSALTGKTQAIPDSPRPARELLPLSGSPADPTSSASFYPRLQRRLKQGDTVVIETGTCMLHLNGALLPSGVTAESQGLWGSIGWATPACLGVAMGKKSGRTWMVTGDGSHLLTLNELAVMGRYNVNPVIFVLNNNLYGIEDILSERGHPYDDLPKVNHHLLPEALGCKGWLSARVSTIAELDKVLDAVESHNGAAYIEVMIPGEESQPLPESVQDRGYKLDTPSPG